MSETNYRLDIGEFRCTVVTDGYISMPVRPPGRSSATNGKPTFKKIDVTCLLIENGQRRILVDTGCGSGFQGTGGRLLDNLREIGISPADIDIIVYTHGHEDHIGGTFDSAGRPVYPGARQVVSRKEWQCWESKPETPLNEHLYALARKTLLTIPEQFEMVEDNYELMPGIQLLPALGHTLGGIMVRITSGEDELLCIGDLIHCFEEFTYPEMFSFLDAAPEEALKLRTEGLREMAGSGVLVYACHFPFPGIGHFAQNNGMLSWQPVSE